MMYRNHYAKQCLENYCQAHCHMEQRVYKRVRESDVIDGLMSVKYQVSKLHIDKKPGYWLLTELSRTYTTYDQTIISDEQMMTWAEEALATGYRDRNGRVFAKHANGLKFVGYLLADGTVDYFYLVLK